MTAYQSKDNDNIKLNLFPVLKIDKSDQKNINMYIPKEAAVFPIRTAMPVAVKKEFASWTKPINTPVLHS